MTPEQIATLFTPLTTVDVNQVVFIVTTDHYLFVGRVEKFEEGVITLLLEDHHLRIGNDLYQLYIYSKLVPDQSAIYAYDERMIEHYQCKFTRGNRPGQWLSIKWNRDNNKRVFVISCRTPLSCKSSHFVKSC